MMAALNALALLIGWTVMLLALVAGILLGIGSISLIRHLARYQAKSQFGRAYYRCTGCDHRLAVPVTEGPHAADEVPDMLSGVHPCRVCGTDAWIRDDIATGELKP